jgi:hypothetical protein
MKVSPSCARWQHVLTTLLTEEALSAQEQADLRAHLAECPECAQLNEQRQVRLAAFRARAQMLPPPQHSVQHIIAKGRYKKPVPQLPEKWVMPFVSQPSASVNSEKQERLSRTHVQLGYHPETCDSLLLSDHDRYAGTYVIGAQGVGKSALLEKLIALDAAGNNAAVIVIDPHGDVTTHCLAELPPQRLASTYLLDLEDEGYPFGLNVFAVGSLDSSIGQARTVDRILHVFEALWPDLLAQQQLPRYLRAATVALLANPGTTLVDMHTFLLDEEMRKTMLKHVTDPAVQQFWQAQYDTLSNAERLRRVQPLLARLEALFMGRSPVRNIVGQRQTSIDFRQAIENREVIFIRLPMKTAAQDARLIGTMLLAQIQAAIFSFATIPETKRPGVSLYIDEFQHFATQDIAELFTEGRKYGVRLTVSHQFRRQLPAYLQDPPMTARTKVIFQVIPDDASEMAQLFLDCERAAYPDNLDPKPVEHLLSYGSDNPAVETFIEWYLWPLQAQKKSGSIEMTRPGFQVEHIPYWLLNTQAPTDTPRVADPTLALNRLLYEVMKTGNATLPIPIEVVLGFANCGQGFYADFRYSVHKQELLSSAVRFPPALVVETSEGTRWIRAPETGQEQLYHFLYHLRMTMTHLAQDPIGKKTQPSTTHVGQMLTQLPRRTAFVLSGEHIGVIYTTDTPLRTTGAPLAARMQAIQEQTRQKYCHSRKAEEALALPHDVDQQRNQESRDKLTTARES